MAKYQTIFGLEAIASFLLSFFPHPPGSILQCLTPLFLVVGAFATLCWIAGFFDSRGPTGPCNCAECIAARYEQEAQLMRGITQHQDAHTAMMRGEIDHARTYGEYRERPDIAEHEQRLRELRSRLR
ncbi:hypothetical protein JQ600_18390 [Bradyrhizobium sp. AUGA SZCCT0176]|uniref:hypothetical protein n=1 Tax=Bradyrhizobium sp. AUGA SZCCT0176 TaxID=2807664 RepID=UPI001BAD98B7|nr:hypothetical protein [Bradyrhizobium sp. AUGA SZCCT0176]MBR1226901.1 hypothetical protein [Bradyrhizobium sp. AUGA SZCCT0176]